MASTTRNRKIPQASNESGTISASASDSDVSIEPLVNERLAKQIQKEFWFRLRHLPSKITRTVGPVGLCLLSLWGLLIYTNHYGPLGYWAAFISWSTDYRKQFTETSFARNLGLNSPALNPYSLWRGVVVISVSTSATYLCIALLALRHELFHWKPEMLEKYLHDAKSSFLGRFVSDSWLSYLFNVYESNYAKRTRDRIQNRDHRATDDHRELAQVVRSLTLVQLVSVLVVFAMWMTLLQTGFESHDVMNLPNSFVPPVQILTWHLIGDTFYFFPHYIAHTPRGSKGIHHRVLPSFLADSLGSFLRNAHKTHHRSKANLAIAAWYCSVTEQVLFNLFPTMLGPVVTQIIADKTGHAKIWGTHLITLYIWLLAATATSVLAHTGFRTSWNDPGKHDEHHEFAFGTNAVNFGTAGFWDTILGTKGVKYIEGAKKWQEQRMRQAALHIASARTGIPLTRAQQLVVEQPMVDYEWIDRRVED
ncbi:Sterol desaturase [Mycena sanguinolenta]|uniref:Sterol desaturase n=1 Tax=Mycena sanguinolenta TaxID=230812 RepID=A0A8H7CK20_9AGAR|nr:Sterol desaturase [Mycena sanguinolenta]